MFVITNPEFGFTVQPLSMFMGVNIEFGFVSQPNSVFNAVNIEFGWGGRLGVAAASAGRGAGRYELGLNAE